MPINKLSVAAVIVAASIAGPAGAYTLHEGAGNFSDNWVSPTAVESGTTGVSGSGSPKWLGGDRIDVFQFSGLEPGAASIVFDFALTGPLNPYAYANGGGSIYVSYVPFSGAYYVDLPGGKVLGSKELLAGKFDVTYNPWQAPNESNRGASSFTLDLDEKFAGDLFLALDFTYGRVDYNIDLASAVVSGGENDPAAIPLPAAGWLLIGGVAGLAGLAARRRITTA